MKKIVTIWQSIAIATLLVAVLYLCAGCEEITAQTNNSEYEDEFCLAEGVGIVLQEIQFTNNEPYLYGEPAYLTDEAQILIQAIFDDETDIWKVPIAAVCWKTSYGGYVVDLD